MSPNHSRTNYEEAKQETWQFQPMKRLRFNDYQASETVAHFHPATGWVSTGLATTASNSHINLPQSYKHEIINSLRDPRSIDFAGAQQAHYASSHSISLSQATFCTSISNEAFAIGTSGSTNWTSCGSAATIYSPSEALQEMSEHTQLPLYNAPATSLLLNDGQDQGAEKRPPQAGENVCFGMVSTAVPS